MDHLEAPLLLYHGTDGTFEKLDPLKSANDGESGVFFTDSLALARTYGARIITAHLLINNPYVVDMLDLEPEDALSPMEAMTAGYDGYIIQSENCPDVYVAFTSEQIYVISDSKLTPEQRTTDWSGFGR